MSEPQNPNPSQTAEEALRQGLMKRSAPFFFKLDLIYLFALLLLAIIYRLNLARIRSLIPDPIGGVLPLGVLWFGMLGGISISLYGVFKNAANWRSSYNYWHAGRPLVGAIFAMIGYFIFIALIQSTGTTPALSGGRRAIPYYIVAFLLGYREETFRLLVKRAVDVLFAPGDKDKPEKDK